MSLTDSRGLSKFKCIHETNDCKKMHNGFNAEAEMNSNDSGEGDDSDEKSSFYSGKFFFTGMFKAFFWP